MGAEGGLRGESGGKKGRREVEVGVYVPISSMLICSNHRVICPIGNHHTCHGTISHIISRN